MKKVGICGNFGQGNDNANGQIAKTVIITEEVKKYYGDKEVMVLNTHGWKDKPLSLFLNCLRMVLSCRNVIILPAQNGIRIFAPMFNTLCKIFGRKLHYSVIGGWLPEFVQKNHKVYKSIKNIKAVYVETKSMEKKLIDLGIKNVVHMPNFKNINPISNLDHFSISHMPYRLCTFSRVKKEKGIVDAITAVKKFNECKGKEVFSLDIYGPIEPGFETEFNNSLFESNGCARYKGTVDMNQSTEIIKDYFALIFPTYYEGEGLPGTVIDSFFSGVPVIASNWRYNSEIVSHGKTGFIYELFDTDERYKGLLDVLKEVYIDPKLIVSMKKNCLEEAKKYNPEMIMKKMFKKMEE